MRSDNLQFACVQPQTSLQIKLSIGQLVIMVEMVIMVVMVTMVAMDIMVVMVVMVKIIMVDEGFHGRAALVGAFAFFNFSTE